MAEMVAEMDGCARYASGFGGSSCLWEVSEAPLNYFRTILETDRLLKMLIGN
jgi:hypothetical protein